MSITLRKSADRGSSNLGWLKSRFTFSFAGYWDPAFDGYKQLRVINEDRVTPGDGFGRHGHSNFEIFSYVLEGSLRHEDSMGNTEVIKKGDVQFTSAGRGIMHSEFNASGKDVVRFLQMWVKPAERDTAPRYDTKSFGVEEKENKLCKILSPDGSDGSIVIGADVTVYASLLENGAKVVGDVGAGRSGYIHVPEQPGSRGVIVNGIELEAGDGAFIEDVEKVEVEGRADDGSHAEFILFDLKE